MNMRTIIAQALLSTVFMALPMITLPRSIKTVPSHKHIVFDVGDVLVRVSKGKAFKQLPFGALISYAVSSAVQGNNPARVAKIIKSRFFQLLNEIEPVDTTEPCPRHGESNEPLPMLMRSWMSGHISSADAIKRVNEFIYAHPEKFANKAEEKLIHAITRITFKPSVLAYTLKLNTKMTDFARLCKKDGHKIYILSNFDSESFALLRRKYSEFFSMFDGVFISGNAQCIKPEEEIYTKFLSKFDLQADECLFIDDRPENVEAARNVGMYACQYNTQQGTLGTYPKPAKAYA